MVVKADGSADSLFNERRYEGEVTTRDVFQVSPDGAYLAYAVGADYRVRSAQGEERTLASSGGHPMMRFSPDSKYLVTRTEHGVSLLDLATGKTRDLATNTTVWQIEWTRDGVVIAAHDADTDLDRLRYIPLGGTAISLIELKSSGNFGRIAAARAGTRVVAALHDAQHTLMAFDVADPAHSHDLVAVKDDVDNIDASPDGSRIAYTTPRGLFMITGDGKPTHISERTDIHSLWFAPDGKLGYASPKIATLLDGKHAVRLEADAIRMLRFDNASSALVAAGNEVRAWDGGKQIKYKNGFGHEVLGADRFAGGLVLWTSPDVSPERRRR